MVQSKTQDTEIFDANGSGKFWDRICCQIQIRLSRVGFSWDWKQLDCNILYVFISSIVPPRPQGLVGEIIVSKDPILTSWDFEVKVALHGIGLKFADEVKIAQQLTLESRLSDILVQCKHKGPKMEEGRLMKSQRRMRRTWLTFAGIGVTEKGHDPRKYSKRLTVEKGKGMNSSLSLQKARSLCQHLDF